jgi:hypothetical protein
MHFNRNRCVYVYQGMLEPASLFRALTGALADLGKSELAMQKLQALLLVVTLLRQHADPKDLEHMLLAFASAKQFRSVEQFLKAAPLLLLRKTPTYNGANLSGPGVGVGDLDNFTVGAHCQCYLRELKCASAWTAAIGASSSSSSTFAGGAARPSPKQRPFKFRVTASTNWHDAPPRYQKIAVDRNTPPNCVKTERYRRRITTEFGTRCQMHPSVYAVHKAVAAAINEGRIPAKKMRE